MMLAPGGLTASWHAHNLEEQVDPRPAQTELHSVCEGAHTALVALCDSAGKTYKVEDLQKDLGLKTFWGQMLCQCPVPCSEDAVGNLDLKMGCAGLSLCSLHVLGCWASSRGSFAQAVVEQ